MERLKSLRHEQKIREKKEQMGFRSQVLEVEGILL